MRVASGRPWNHNIHYHDVVLNAVPAKCRRALDAGCGAGLPLARRLAHRSDEVIAVEIDAATLARAIEAHACGHRITFRQGDVMVLDLGDESFDFIAVVATLHHLPLRPALARFRELLKPGGVLAIVGLYRLRMPTDYAMALIALPTSWLLRLRRGVAAIDAPVTSPREALSEIKTACDAILPGAKLHRHLLFRYSLILQKP